MTQHILKLLSFRLSGPYAHFRKFYTNSSSLSYLIPPRTVIMGILASVLEYARDSYYQAFDPQKIKISARIAPETSIKKKMQSLNYIHSKYFSYLCKLSSDGKKNMHTQCKLELLVPHGKTIAYRIYIGTRDQSSVELLDQLESRLRQSNWGYGIYLGQRQFKGAIDKLKVHTEDSISFLEEADYTDTLFVQDNNQVDVKDARNLDSCIVVDQMPIHMQKESTNNENGAQNRLGREIQSVNRIVYEKSGKRIYGKFRNAYALEDEIITFYEG